MQRLCAAEDGGERLDGGADHVVVRLLRCEGATGRLSMEAQSPGARVLRAVALDHGFVPDATRGAVLGDLFEEIVVRVEEKRELRDELVDGQATAHSPLDVLETIAKGEGQFLNGGRAGFADVVAADGNGVELGSVLHAKFEGVDDQAHRGFGRVDVLFLRDVFLEDVILQRAGNFLPVRALLFGDREIHGPDHRRRRIDGHGSGDAGQWNFVKEHFHIREGADGHAALADFAFGERVVGVVTH